MVKSKQYAFPARFIDEENGAITVYFPDLDGCQTYDDTIAGAAIMAKEALEGYISVLMDLGQELPPPSNIDDLLQEKGLIMMVVADIKGIDDENKPVKKTLSIPKWLDREATSAHINFSGVLKEALIERLKSL